MPTEWIMAGLIKPGPVQLANFKYAQKAQASSTLARRNIFLKCFIKASFNQWPARNARKKAGSLSLRLPAKAELNLKGGYANNPLFRGYKTRPDVVAICLHRAVHYGLGERRMLALYRF